MSLSVADALLPLVTSSISMTVVDCYHAAVKWLTYEP